MFIFLTLLYSIIYLAGEDIVVDDIQFCSNVPIDYCPTPELSSTQPIYGKNYLWCSPWLTNKTPLIEPLDSNELK